MGPDDVLPMFLQIFSKKLRFVVDDGVQRAIFAIPPKAGPDILGVGSRNFWDCKLELNFVPVYRAVALGEGGQIGRRN